MAILTRDQILQADDMKTEDVLVPEWGGTVRVHCLSAEGRDLWELSILGDDVEGGTTRNLTNARAKLVVRCAVDEEGNPLFTESDIVLLGKKSAAALDRVFAACKRLNKIDKDDIEELVGNSNDGPKEDSTSA